VPANDDNDNDGQEREEGGGGGKDKRAGPGPRQFGGWFMMISGITVVIPTLNSAA
jgi:hypothetical protein